MKRLLIEEIRNMNYTDFIAYAGQWNVPPGSFSTINEWAVFSRVDKNSRVLEIACTTGFSGRELAKLTGCSVHGIDISEASICQAQKDASDYAPRCRLSYECIDLFDLPEDIKYTHIVMGASIQFFQRCDAVMQKLLNLLDDGGYILVSPYYLKDGPLPCDIIEDAQRVINIYPTDFGYDKALEFYKDFEILYASRKDIIIETEEQMQKYVSDTIERCCATKNIIDREIKQLLYERLYEIKTVCNRIHNYHAFAVMVLRYEKIVYPNRFVELF